MASVAQAIADDPNVPRPDSLQAYIHGLTLESASLPDISPAQIHVSPLDIWRLENVDGKPLIQEKLTFPSRMREGDAFTSPAVFFLYRQGNLGQRPVILWLPGMGFSDIAFRFVKRFYAVILKHDYDLLVWVPPYHLMRQRNGADAGERFFGANTTDNLHVLIGSVREIRTAVNYLENQGVKKIGGWGGSLGASVLWLTSTTYAFDHMTLMIPVVDWRSVVLEPPEMQALRSRFEKLGCTPELLSRAYLKVSPVAYETLVPASRIQILHARYDQLTPEARMLEFANRRGIRNVVGYDRSHATILLTSQLYTDYALFLDEMETQDIQGKHDG